MVIVGLVLILVAGFELSIHQEIEITSYDGPSGSGYNEMIINLPYWVYPMLYIGLTIGTVGLIFSIKLLDSKRVQALYGET
jgi:hypothetical protein